MPGPEFSFDVELPGRGVPDGMVEELTTRLLEHVGCASRAAGVAGDLIAAVSNGAGAPGPCHVRFVAHDGCLELTVSANHTRIWHTSCPIP